MGETANTDKASKTPFFKGVKVEFKKISWPDKNMLVKQSIAVILVSVAMGLLITLLDTVIKYGINFLTM